MEPAARDRLREDALGRGPCLGDRHTGPVAFTFAADNNPFNGGTGGPNFITYGNGMIEERFNHTQTVQHNPRLSTQLRIDGPGSSVGNFSASTSGRGTTRSRTNSSSPRPAAPSLEKIRNENDGHNYEIGGDFEFKLGPGRLKLIALESYRRRTSRPSR